MCRTHGYVSVVVCRAASSSRTSMGPLPWDTLNPPQYTLKVHIPASCPIPGRFCLGLRLTPSFLVILAIPLTVGKFLSLNRHSMKMLSAVVCYFLSGKRSLNAALFFCLLLLLYVFQRIIFCITLFSHWEEAFAFYVVQCCRVPSPLGRSLCLLPMCVANPLSFQLPLPCLIQLLLQTPGGLACFFCSGYSLLYFTGVWRFCCHFLLCVYECVWVCVWLVLFCAAAVCCYSLACVTVMLVPYYIMRYL